MEKELRWEYFNSLEELVGYVNSHWIEKEDIQGIIMQDVGKWYLIFWR